MIVRATERLIYKTAHKMVTQIFGKQIFMAFRNVNRFRKECIHVNQLIADTHVDSPDSDITLKCPYFAFPNITFHAVCHVAVCEQTICKVVKPKHSVCGRPITKDCAI